MGKVMFRELFLQLAFPSPLYKVRQIVKQIRSVDGKWKHPGYPEFEIVFDAATTAAYVIGTDIDDAIIRGDLIGFLAHTGKIGGLHLVNPSGYTYWEMIPRQSPLPLTSPAVYSYASPVMIPTLDGLVMIAAVASACQISLENASWIFHAEKYDEPCTPGVVAGRITECLDRIGRVS